MSCWLVSSLSLTFLEEMTTKLGWLASWARQQPRLQATQREAAVTNAEQDQESRSNGKLILQLSDICLSSKGRGYLTNSILYLRRKYCSSFDWFTRYEICTLPSLLQDDGFRLSHRYAVTLHGCLKKSRPEWEVHLVESKIVCRGWNTELECISIKNSVAEWTSSHATGCKRGQINVEYPRCFGGSKY